MQGCDTRRKHDGLSGEGVVILQKFSVDYL